MKKESSLLVVPPHILVPNDLIDNVNISPKAFMLAVYIIRDHAMRCGELGPYQWDVEGALKYLKVGQDEFLKLVDELRAEGYEF